MRTITEMGAGTDIVTQTLLDADTGNVLEQRQPSAAGLSTDAGVRKTTYYGAGAHNPSTCTSDAWFGQVCRIGPGVQPAGNALPTTTYGSYDQYLRPTVTTESVGTGTANNRVTTTSYDADGWGNRTLSSSTTGGVGTEIDPSTSTYCTPADSGCAVTGLPLTVTDGTSTITTTYDDFGRKVSVQDADGGVTTSTYDPDTGQLTGTALKKTPTGSTWVTATYEYGSATDKRGLLTSVAYSDVDTAMGTATPIIGSYDADGELTTQNLPGGIVQTLTQDPSGDTTAMAYTKGGAEWLAEQQLSSIHGQVWVRTGANQPWSASSYAYDNAGRLITATEDRTVEGAGCVTRTYEFAGSAGRNGNRTATKAYPADANGECTTGTTPVTTAFAYDAADRLTSPSSTHDAWGRIATLNSSLTAGGAAGAGTFYNTDFVRTWSTGTDRRTYDLDPAQRIRAVTTTQLSTSTDIASTVNHYSDSSDSPAWMVDTDLATSTTSTVRQVEGLGGDRIGEISAVGSGTGVLSIDLGNIHGDIVRTTSPTATAGPDGVVNDADEFGVLRNSASASNTPTPSPRYGWLGGKQRAADTGNGIVLMGVRLYAPVMGRFLQIDPVYGGGANAYAYPLDPISMFDLDGRMWERGWLNARKNYYGGMLWRHKWTIASLVPVGGWYFGGFRAANYAAKTRYASRLSRVSNGNRARMTVSARGGRYHYDLHGKAHFSKSKGHFVRTPHYRFQPYNYRAPNGWGRQGDVHAMRWRDLYRARRSSR